MADTKQPAVSIQDQILKRMFSDLQDKEGFTPEIIQALTDLSQHGKLSKDKEVSKVLKP
jgi:hypothetical protein